MHIEISFRIFFSEPCSPHSRRAVRVAPESPAAEARGRARAGDDISLQFVLQTHWRGNENKLQLECGGRRGATPFSLAPFSIVVDTEDLWAPSMAVQNVTVAPSQVPPALGVQLLSVFECLSAHLVQQGWILLVCIVVTVQHVSRVGEVT